MLIIFLLLILGVLFGLLFRGRAKLVKYIERLTNWVIWLLLLFLGISVGSNDEIINNISTIGFNAVIISISAVVGSVVISWVVYKFCFVSDKQSLNKSNEK